MYATFSDISSWIMSKHLQTFPRIPDIPDMSGTMKHFQTFPDISGAIRHSNISRHFQIFQIFQTFLELLDISNISRHFQIFYIFLVLLKNQPSTVARVGGTKQSQHLILYGCSPFAILSDPDSSTDKQKTCHFSEAISWNFISVAWMGRGRGRAAAAAAAKKKKTYKQIRVMSQW